MENPAKLLCQNKGRDANDKTMKALANDMNIRQAENRMEEEDIPVPQPDIRQTLYRGFVCVQER